MAQTYNRCLGIDIGGTTAKYAIINHEGQLLDKDVFRTGRDVTREAFLETLYGVVDGALQKGIDGVGVCSLGFVDSRSGQILGGVENLPFLNGLNLPALLSARYPGLPVYIQNDVKAVALGEQWLGAGRNCSCFFCITFGTGLGGALVLDGRVVEGAHFRAGEIAYLQYRDAQSYFEKQASTAYLVNQAAEQLHEAEMDGFRFFCLYRQGDPVCRQILEDWLLRIGRCIADLIIILDLEKIIVGGGISDEKDILIPQLERVVSSMLPEPFRGQCAVVAAQCTNNAGMLGAVSQMLRREREMEEKAVDSRKKTG